MQKKLFSCLMLYNYKRHSFYTNTVSKICMCYSKIVLMYIDNTVLYLKCSSSFLTFSQCKFYKTVLKWGSAYTVQYSNWQKSKTLEKPVYFASFKHTEHELLQSIAKFNTHKLPFHNGFM